MTVLQTAYDTTACRDHLMTKTLDALAVAYSHGQLTSLPDCAGIVQVQGGASVVDAVPAFAHPLLMKSPDGQHLIAIDARPFGKWDQNQQQFHVRNEVEYALLTHRARLTAIWMNENPSLLRDISQVPIAAYSMWVSEAIAKRYALDPRQQFNLAILAAVFYCSQFSDDTEMAENDKMRMVNQITKALRASAKDVMDVIDKYPVVTSMTHYCQLAEDVSGSIRMKDLNIGILCTILAGTWFGTNAREAVCVAIEHPPTWIAILMQAITERSYKNSAITKIIERSQFRDSTKGLLHGVLNLEASIKH